MNWQGNRFEGGQQTDQRPGLEFFAYLIGQDTGDSVAGSHSDESGFYLVDQ
jgi:hypothetical protein